MSPEKEKILEANASVWRDRAQRAEAELEKLRAFKAYVHARLDKANVPSNPDPEKNKEHGCRVEGRLNFLVAQRDRCERYGLATLPGVEFCRKGGARVVAEKLEDQRAQLAKVTAERDAAVERAKTEIARKQWVTDRIEAELRRAGIELQWTDGGGAACPGGWHRNPYLNIGNIADVSRDLAAAQATAAQHEKALEATRARCAFLKSAIDRDRTGLAAALNRIINEVRSRSWLLEGRGAYEWDDVRYKEEAGIAMREVKNIADDALSASGKLANQAFHAPDAGVAEWLRTKLDEARDEQNRLRGAQTVEREALRTRVAELEEALFDRCEQAAAGGRGCGLDSPSKLCAACSVAAGEDPSWLAAHDAQVEAKTQRKLDDLAERYKALEAQSAEQRRQLAAVRTDRDNVWLWQGDGNDRPSSLACPVVMTPDTLRDLLAEVEAKALEKAAKWMNDNGYIVPQPDDTEEDAGKVMLRALASKDGTTP